MVVKMGASTQSRPRQKRWAKSSPWYTPGRKPPIGCGVSKPSIAPLMADWSLLHPQEVLVGEDQRVGVDIETLHRLAPLPGDGIGGKQPGVLHQFHTLDALQQG